MSTEKIKGVITYAEKESVKGVQGFFVQFNGMKGLLAKSHKEEMWISKRMAKDWGILEGEYSEHGSESKLVGKKLKLIEWIN